MKNDVLYRVVTLTGQIIEKSGTMSGGGRYHRHSLMKLKNGNHSHHQQQQDDITEEMIAQADNAVKVLSSQLSEAQRTLSNEKVSIVV